MVRWNFLTSPALLHRFSGKPYLTNLLRISAIVSRACPLQQLLVLPYLRDGFGWDFFETGQGKLAHLSAATKFFGDLGIPAPGFHVMVVGGTERIGGPLVGWATRVASAISIVVTHLTAHRGQAFASMQDFAGRKPFAYLCVVLMPRATGPGKFSPDAAMRSGPRVRAA